MRRREKERERQKGKEKERKKVWSKTLKAITSSGCALEARKAPQTVAGHNGFKRMSILRRKVDLEKSVCGSSLDSSEEGLKALQTI